jgi:hypothetical protein
MSKGSFAYFVTLKMANLDPPPLSRYEKCERTLNGLVTIFKHFLSFKARNNSSASVIAAIPHPDIQKINTNLKSLTDNLLTSNSLMFLYVPYKIDT